MNTTIEKPKKMTKNEIPKINTSHFVDVYTHVPV
jgi:hypothetical protein